MGFLNCLAVDIFGLGGGFAVLVKEEVVIETRSFSRNHVDISVEFEKPYMLTLFCGSPVRERRKQEKNGGAKRL